MLRKVAPFLPGVVLGGLVILAAVLSAHADDRALDRVAAKEAAHGVRTQARMARATVRKRAHRKLQVRHNRVVAERSQRAYAQHEPMRTWEVTTGGKQGEPTRTYGVTTGDRSAPPVCHEDDPCWDCATMGNHVCGPGATRPEPSGTNCYEDAVPGNIDGCVEGE